MRTRDAFRGTGPEVIDLANPPAIKSAICATYARSAQVVNERREKAQEDRLAKAFKDIYSALGYSIEDAECRAVIRARRSARILRRSPGA